MKRSKLEIMAAIMSECLVPRHKTHIMYNCNLSFDQTNTYLRLLIPPKLLSRENGTYQTTDKGLRFLSAYDELSKIIGMPGLASDGNEGLLKLLNSYKT
jgi:predicted transcriptional regulator